jgi:hypothetical protein
MPHVSSAIKWYTILAIAYLGFALLLPANKVAMHNYNLTSGQYHILMLVVLIPYIAIWFAAFYGYAKLQEYASKISSTPEGPGFKSIANGFQWLAWGLPVPALISLFWLLITTVIVPYLFAWFSGLLAAYEMLLYGRVVSGVFYRQAMRLLAVGMTSVIASLIFVQYIRSVTPRSGHLSLNSTLLLINIVYVCMAVGFLLMSIAAARLKRIEEV